METLKSSILNTFFVVILIFILSQCKQPNSTIHDKIIKTSISSNNKYTAEISTDKTLSYYFLTIKNIDRDSSIIFDSLICMKGYHEPVFNLKWDDPQSLLEISVDNDFGENVQFYTFDVMSNKLRESN